MMKIDGYEEEEEATTSVDDPIGHNGQSRDSLLRNNSDLAWASNLEDRKAIVDTIDDAIEAIGVGKFQWRLIIALGICFSADAIEVMLLSFLSLTLQSESEWGITSTQAAGLTASVFVGMILGGLLLGFLGDHIGRRPTYLAACAITAVFGVLSAFSPGYKMLLTIRFVVGFGIGGTNVTYDALAEFLPEKSRVAYLIATSFFWTLGSLLSSLLAYLTLEKSWRLFLILSSIPTMLSGLLGIFLVPESPRWLISTGNEEKALHILRDAAVVNGLDSDALFPQGMKLKDEHVKSSRFRDLLSPRWRKISLLLWVTWIGMEVGYYGLIILISRVFDRDARTPQSTHGDAPQFNYSSILISSSAEMVGVLIAMKCVGSFGRAHTQAGSFLLGGILVFTLSFFADTGSDVVLTIISCFCRAVEVIGSSALWMYTAEIFTTEIRTTGHAAANAMGRAGSSVAPFIVKTSNSFLLVGSIMLGIHIITAISAVYLPETKGYSLGHSSDDEKRKVADSKYEVERVADDFFEQGASCEPLL